MVYGLGLTRLLVRFPQEFQARQQQEVSSPLHVTTVRILHPHELRDWTLVSGGRERRVPCVDYLLPHFSQLTSPTLLTSSLLWRVPCCRFIVLKYSSNKTVPLNIRCFSFKTYASKSEFLEFWEMYFVQSRNLLLGSDWERSRSIHSNWKKEKERFTNRALLTFDWIFI